MTTHRDSIQRGLDACDYFLKTWNSRDPEHWAGSLNFPHVRPSPFGSVTCTRTAEEYISGVNFQEVIDSGWDHSEWDYRSALHASSSKVHVAGQWSRYNAEGEVILTTPIVYIVTNNKGHWGIQSRFGADYVSEDTDTAELQSRGFSLVQDFINQQNLGNRLACAEMLNYPHFTIGAGELGRTESSDEFQLCKTEIIIEGLRVIQSGRHSLNMTIDLTELKNNQTLQGVVHINDRNNHLGVQAWSLLDPNELS